MKSSSEGYSPLYSAREQYTPRRHGGVAAAAGNLESAILSPLLNINTLFHDLSPTAFKAMKSKFTRCSSILIIALAFLTNPVLADESVVTVWKSPSCGCCQGWVDYLQDNGFEVVAHNTNDVVLVKNKLGLTNPALHSCHTATIGDYVVEGHVPVADIRRLLSERPNIVGLTAPGMPQLSPGMYSIEPKDYDVLQFDQDQKTSVYSSY